MKSNLVLVCVQYFQINAMYFTFSKILQNWLDGFWETKWRVGGTAFLTCPAGFTPST